MNQEELLRLAAPVRKFLNGKSVTRNTVLAAYLRSQGLPITGRIWEVAIAAVDAGLGFEEAVAQASRLTGEKHSRAAGSRSDQASDHSTLSALEREHRRADLKYSRREGRARRAPLWLPSLPGGNPTFEWYSDRFSPGSLVADGARKLLGTPRFEIHEVLVRETAQNSWDAGRDASEIDFTLNLRQITGPEYRYLADAVISTKPPRTGLDRLNQQDSMWVLEIHDRGTIGLGGPVRNDKEPKAEESTDFIDFVFNIGAPRDIELGGGTYGFGKTISYIASSVGTVIIWSQVEESGRYKQRLIGSTIGGVFNDNGYRYTGRHWCGKIVDGNRIEPLQDSEARAAGEVLFSKPFEVGETGTSLLILDPLREGENPQDVVEKLARAVQKNLWPKLLEDQTGRLRMNIRVELDGDPVDIGRVEAHPKLQGYAAALRAVRAAQEEGVESDPSWIYPIEVVPIEQGRPKTTLGHLALTRFPISRGDQDVTHSVALMRHRAELVVKYLEFKPLDATGFQWAGVFKPLSHVDDAFALAEPPAHDDWVPASIQDRTKKSHVNVALRRIRDAVQEYLSFGPRTSDSHGQLQSSVVAGNALAALVGGGGAGAGASKRSPGRVRRVQSRRRGRRPRVRITQQEILEGSTAHWVRHVVTVIVESPVAASINVDAELRVGVDGASQEDSGAMRLLGWYDQDSEKVSDSTDTFFRDGDIQRFEFESRADLAIDIAFKVKDS